MTAITAMAGPVLFAGGAHAQSVTDYDACINLLQRVPAAASRAAAEWRDQGGGFAARHCLALALEASGQQRIAASRLESLARDMAESGALDNASDVMAQAAVLWTRANNPDQSLSLLSDALVWTPEKPTLLVDRAHAHLAKGAPDAALQDLDKAIALGVEDADAYTVRAMIRRRAGNSRAAYDDVARALILDPLQANARLERARIRIDLNDLTGARADLASVLQNHANEPAAETARQILQKLEAN